MCVSAPWFHRFYAGSPLSSIAGSSPLGELPPYLEWHLPVSRRSAHSLLSGTGSTPKGIEIILHNFDIHNIKHLSIISKCAEIYLLL